MTPSKTVPEQCAGELELNYRVRAADSDSAVGAYLCAYLRDSYVRVEQGIVCRVHLITTTLNHSILQNGRGDERGA